jgi:hypothetical protein
VCRRVRRSERAVPGFPGMALSSILPAASALQTPCFERRVGAGVVFRRAAESSDSQGTLFELVTGTAKALAQPRDVQIPGTVCCAGKDGKTRLTN